MAFDLALAPNGDLVFAANRDWLGVSGTPQIEQRMRTRIKIPRGSWVYDENQGLGSRIHRVLQQAPDRAVIEIPVFIREALDDMDDIAIQDVQVVMDGRSVRVVIDYAVMTLPEAAEETAETESTDQLIMSLPL
jgi:phage baseplate assembly protein W